MVETSSWGKNIYKPGSGPIRDVEHHLDILCWWVCSYISVHTVVEVSGDNESSAQLVLGCLLSAAVLVQRPCNGATCRMYVCGGLLDDETAAVTTQRRPNHSLHPHAATYSIP